MTMQPYHHDPAVTLYQGEALATLQTLPDNAVDALMTDPPYSSGGFTRGDRNQDPGDKYVQDGVGIIRPSFTGDNRDGRSWCYWCALWLSECARIVKPGGYALMFTDWRMLPLATDALQAAGWLWRGIIAWDKGQAARAPHKGYFRHQCEYIVWGTRGQCAQATHAGPWPGCYRVPVLQADKHHMTGKPTALMAALCECVPPGAAVLDPFAGSGTTLVAAAGSGRRAIGIEKESEYCRITVDRLRQIGAQPDPAGMESPPDRGTKSEPAIAPIDIAATP